MKVARLLDSWSEEELGRWGAAAQKYEGRFKADEVELRAYIETRHAYEPLVLNRYHLTPNDHRDEKRWSRWPDGCIYIGHPPARTRDPRWRISGVLKNPFAFDQPRDREKILGRYRAHVWRELKRRGPLFAALRDVTPETCFVCSCARESPIAPPTASRACCHGHILVMAWRWLMNHPPCGLHRWPALRTLLEGGDVSDDDLLMAYELKCIDEAGSVTEHGTRLLHEHSTAHASSRG